MVPPKKKLHWYARTQLLMTEVVRCYSSETNLEAHRKYSISRGASFLVERVVYPRAPVFAMFANNIKYIVQGYVTSDSQLQTHHCVERAVSVVSCLQGFLRVPGCRLDCRRGCSSTPWAVDFRKLHWSLQRVISLHSILFLAKRLPF